MLQVYYVGAFFLFFRCVPLRDFKGGALGQGANASLQDVVALDKVLDECNDDLDAALPLFSARQVKEGLALWSLLQLMTTKNKTVAMLYALATSLRPRMQRYFKSWPQPTFSSISQTMKPYSEVVKENGLWVTLTSLGKKRVVPSVNVHV